VKHGFNVIGSCGLAEWKEKGKPLVYSGEGKNKKDKKQ
jgi:hypothetical protein